MKKTTDNGRCGFYASDVQSQKEDIVKKRLRRVLAALVVFLAAFVCMEAVDPILPSVFIGQDGVVIESSKPVVEKKKKKKSKKKSSESDSQSQESSQSQDDADENKEGSSENSEKKSDNENAVEINEDGEYTSKEEVAAYLHEFGHLPSNYITKREAQDLGWDSRSGNLDEIAPGKSIGGDRFGNYEGLLPSDKKYKECDIDYDGGYRGSKRIIFSDDGDVYYTEDHYQTFEKLY